MNQPEAIYHNGRTYSAHCAWLDSLRGDEYRIVHTPVGFLFDLAMVAAIKRILAAGNADTDTVLRCLEMLSRIADGFITHAAIGVVKPMCDRGQKILRQITSLPVEKQIRAFSDGDVFRLLAKLNPSLLTALGLCAWRGPVPE